MNKEKRGVLSCFKDELSAGTFGIYPKELKPKFYWLISELEQAWDGFEATGNWYVEALKELESTKKELEEFKEFYAIEQQMRIQDEKERE